MDKVSVVRDAEGMTEARMNFANCVIATRMRRIDDQGTTFNTDLTEALELGAMLDCADTLVTGALAREESRGAHFRDDFETRDDTNWLKPHNGCRRLLAG